MIGAERALAVISDEGTESDTKVVNIEQEHIYIDSENNSSEEDSKIDEESTDTDTDDNESTGSSDNMNTDSGNEDISAGLSAPTDRRVNRSRGIKITIVSLYDPYLRSDWFSLWVRVQINKIIALLVYGTFV